ncbi:MULTISPECIES: glycosyltransferase family 52 [unclassified Bacillus cereus group]|uniref:glycosyltransferase family 52 n=1 Tax=unclassified Bacillus cereus group TaxID=2750818 RepID=UPI000A37068E|nr:MULTISPECIES: glycosyltransferase family 52 [unclassified Bacillus cereus group]MDA1591852.1 glycosyltransferase family 52 [Bacillus cereus group sp. TH225LC]OUA63806.1 hypothetical protein BK786_23400 [Bacillus thuringiensis serovar thailandensis]PKF98745.1 hypothetical protein CW365_07505 [Bacillus cereus]HDR7524098.1 hypothetical protein [Bacillus paranthracis]
MNKEAIFICQTPLHVLCASIIANKKKDTYASRKIVITDHKIHNGVKEVIEYFKWDSVEYCIIPKNKTSKLMHFFLKSVTSKFKGSKKDLDVYCGNFWSIYTKCMMLNYKTENLYTFDDGVYNLFLESQEDEHITKENSAIKIINKLMGLEISSYELFSKIRKHYSIFNKDYSKVYKETDIIETDFQNVGLNCDVEFRDEIWLLTQPFNEEKLMTYQQELDIYKYIVKENRYLGKNIKVKLHPRSNPEIVRDLNLEIIDSAEPLELLLLKKRPKVLIGVNSTALITSKLLDKDILSKSYFVGDNDNHKVQYFKNYGVECFSVGLNQEES